ncbi:MAG TPA: phosphate-starvation-inducible PsiE family protein [Coriobacteriia bacterium]
MEKPKSVVMERFLTALHWAIIGIEVLVAVALTALAAGALASLAMEMWSAASTGHALTHPEFTSIMAEVLQVFILVELFRVTIAYMKHENVIPTVLEAALVAVARKFVVFESGSDALVTAAGLSALLLAVAISWWLLAKSNACRIETES